MKHHVYSQSTVILQLLQLISCVITIIIIIINVTLYKYPF